MANFVKLQHAGEGYDVYVNPDLVEYLKFDNDVEIWMAGDPRINPVEVQGTLDEVARKLGRTVAVANAPA